MVYASILFATLAAATLGGVLGFGTASLMLPILAIVFGAEHAVPIVGFSMVFANASRAVLCWNRIDWKVVATYGAAAVPAGLVGALAYVRLDLRWVNFIIAIFILLLVPLRRWSESAKLNVRLWQLPVLGVAVGSIQGVGAVVGPAAAPFFISYGLVRAAYLGTEGASSTMVQGTKALTYWLNGKMTPWDAWMSCLMGLAMIGGSIVGRKLVDRLDAKSYIWIIEAGMVVLGAYMLAMAIRKL